MNKENIVIPISQMGKLRQLNYYAQVHTAKWHANFHLQRIYLLRVLSDQIKFDRLLQKTKRYQ